ncbi:MAG TPA: hypothetical protein VKN36_05495 [Eudoraea sp.]|nr:hypothetical protein [Eudoraea sp.]
MIQKKPAPANRAERLQNVRWTFGSEEPAGALETLQKFTNLKLLDYSWRCDPE